MDDPRRRLSTAGLNALIEQLGFVQVDSINMVERAHHMILFSRSQSYRPKNLKRLLERDRTLFENWTHDASVIPTRYYAYWKHRFRRDETVLAKRFRKWFDDGFELQLERLMERVGVEGEIMARDLAGEEAPRQRGWWDWHAGKTGLEYLWRTGRLSVSRREGFQKVYDLSERVIPADYRDAYCHDGDFVAWACRTALQRLGFGSPGDIARFWDLIGISEVKEWLAGEGANDVCEVLVHATDGTASRQMFAPADITEVFDDGEEAPRRLRILNPFDPLLRDRNRLQWMMNFDYRIEVFVPAAQRRYGYYVFPILEGDRLIGRVDMKAERKSDLLKVTALWLEKGVAFGRLRRQRFDAELDRVRRFAGLEGVHVADDFLRR
jgi:hypothetical protein